MLKKRPEWTSAVLVVFVVFFLGLSLSPYVGADDASAADAVNRSDESSAVTLQLSDLLEEDGLFYYPRDAEYPFTGELNAGLERGQIKDGKREGLWGEYHPMGPLMVEGEYKSGKREGLWLFYVIDGISNRLLFRAGEYKGGKREGRWAFFNDANGKLRNTHSYKNGELDGPWFMYRYNGQVWWKGEYKNGERDGPSVRYHRNGELSYKVTYKNGKEEGPEVHYYENGQLKSKVTYRNGKREGPWVDYYGHGQLKGNGTYRNGERVFDKGMTGTYYNGIKVK